MRKTIIDLVLETKVVAIVRGLDNGYAELIRAMYDGGIRAVEVTFNQKDPSQWSKTTHAIREIKALMGDTMAVGAGTVTSVELVELAREAGAQFIVSPDTNAEVIRRTKELGMVSMPGAMTATEALTAHNAGADFVKLFPAGALGVAYVKAVRAPLNHIRFLAVGGVSEKNVAEFIKAGCVGVGVGGNLVNKDWIANGEFHKIRELAQELCCNAGG